MPLPAQPQLFRDPALLPSIDEDVASEHGEVFTRRWVVDLILDLCGYTEDQPLHDLVCVEPACGTGAFLVPIVERLVASVQSTERDIDGMTGAIVGRDLLQANVDAAQANVRAALIEAGVAAESAARLASAWIKRDDFLLADLPEQSANVVVGNPPYIRLEAVPPARSAAYRRACSTMSGRADVYVGFYEKALRLLADDGMLGFICADRWMRNAYGASLRELISARFAVQTIIDMHGVDAFEDAVDAYPAVTVLRRAKQESGPVVVHATPGFATDDAPDVLDFVRTSKPHHTRDETNYSAARLAAWFTGRASWPSGRPTQLDLLADLEGRFSSLEDAATGTKVGIGVATGADRVFIVDEPTKIESERLLRLALSRDLSDGRVRWSGSYLVNPWSASGLVDLDEWPQLREYLTSHRAVLSRRHVARSGVWHKTIDRVVDGLVDRPKLYVPDFGERLAPVLDGGGTYPHHNLYWVVSDDWDLRVLGGLLMSDIANFFVSSYSVRMRGGYLRFQAQYLRRIRVPKASAIDETARQALIDAFERRDHDAATRTALPLYGLDAAP